MSPSTPSLTPLRTRMDPHRRVATRQLLGQVADDVRERDEVHAGPWGGYRRPLLMATGAAFAVTAVVTGVQAVSESSTPVAGPGAPAVPSSDASDPAGGRENLLFSPCGVLIADKGDKPNWRTLTYTDPDGYTQCVDIWPSPAGRPKDPAGMAGSTLTDPDGKEIGMSGGSTTHPRTTVTLDGDEITMLSPTIVQAFASQAPVPSGLALGDPIPLTEGAFQLYGLVGPDVTGIDVLLENGTRIPAVVKDGMWATWWQAGRGHMAGSLIELHSGTGSRIVSTQSLADAAQ